MTTFIGILWLILGFCILASPITFGLISISIIGALMIIAGLLEFYRVFKVETFLVRIIWFLVSIITFATGLLILAYPLFGMSLITVLLSLYFLIDGCIKIYAAYKYPFGKGWFLTSGILSFFLGGFIWSGWPLSGTFAIGALVGIYFIFTGVTLLVTRKNW
jgi:uncharacterized membrane protein HdeD (DUF308 family)